MQTSTEKANIGIVGTSINPEKQGLRFISRFACVNKDGAYYVNLGGTEYKVEKMGMLITSVKGLQTTGSGELDFNVIQSPYVRDICVYDAGGDGTEKYYDRCNDYADISVCVIGLKTDINKTTEFVVRGYMQVEINGNPKVFYTTQHTDTYN